ncbi:MAG: TRC40/GET3/ArsA family transport-energizing ATPase [Candidatus Sericytochromatia bacterium]|nr:TRC40/GET3/ArsA family transport-energizing ATPase [Candidatus Sericytochromatia bacterium]
MRVLMFCGKGGCGKSTLAAAAALRAAQEGARTLLLSVDPAHSLGTILGRPVGASPTAVAERLWAAELAPAEAVTGPWREGLAYVEQVLSSQLAVPPAGAELALLPGVAEAATLVTIEQHLRSGQFDAVVLDHAPTSFAVRLLALPQLGGGYGRKARTLYERHGAQLQLGLTMLGASVPPPPPGLPERALGLLEGLEALAGMLTDPATTSVRLVVPPEAPGLAESRYLYTWLSLYGLTVDEVLVNPLWPATVADPLVALWRQREAQVVDEVRQAFAPLTITSVTRQVEALTGLEALLEFAAALWPARGVLPRRGTHAACEVTRDGGSLQVQVRLPFVPREAVDLAKHGDELYITVWGHQRIVRLPGDAAAMQPTRARFEDGSLIVTLAPPA